jgi:hypothetical protein
MLNPFQMKKYLFIIINCISLACWLQAPAQDHETQNEFSLSGQIRPRFEFRSGNFRPLSKSEDPAALITNRLRIILDYSHSDIVKTKFSIQEVGIWGQHAPVQGLNPAGNDLTFFEGWVDLKIYKGLRMIIGRQTILLDDERLFGISDWTPGGRSHDAVSIYYSEEKFKISSFFAFNQNYAALYNNNLNNPSGSLHSPDGAQPYKLMQTLWMEYKPSDIIKLSFLFSNVGYQHALSSTEYRPVYDQQTTGLNFFLNKASTAVALTGYYQFGDNPSGTHTAAFLLSAKISEQLGTMFSATAGMDYLSGNRYGRVVNSNHAFQTLFGTNHKFYGDMDYFYSGNMEGHVGLINTYLSAGLDLSEKVNLNVIGYMFHAPSAIYRDNEKLHNDLGKEVDLKLSLKVTPFADLSAGLSGYFTSGSLLYLEKISNARSFQSYGWLSLNVHPEFFSFKF